MVSLHVSGGKATKNRPNQHPRGGANNSPCPYPWGGVKAERPFKKKEERAGTKPPCEAAKNGRKNEPQRGPEKGPNDLTRWGGRGPGSNKGCALVARCLVMAAGCVMRLVMLAVWVLIVAGQPGVGDSACGCDPRLSF